MEVSIRFDICVNWGKGVGSICLYVSSFVCDFCLVYVDTGSLMRKGHCSVHHHTLVEH